MPRELFDTLQTPQIISSNAVQNIAIAANIGVVIRTLRSFANDHVNTELADVFNISRLILRKQLGENEKLRVYFASFFQNRFQEE